MLKKESEALLKEALKELKEVHQAIRNLQTAATAADITLGLTHIFIREEPIYHLLVKIMDRSKWS